MSKIITTKGIVRLSYEHVWEATSVNGEGDPKYSASFIIPKKDKKTIAQIEEAVEEAKQEGLKSKWGGKLPKKLKLPLRDGDEEREEDETYSNSMFVNASCNQNRRPLIVDVKRNEIIDKSDVYSGCYGLAVINFYPYDRNGNKGIACGLTGFIKVKDGEPLGSVVTVDDMFEGVDLSDLNLEDDDDDL